MVGRNISMHPYSGDAMAGRGQSRNDAFASKRPASAPAKSRQRIERIAGANRVLLLLVLAIASWAVVLTAVFLLV
jgi:hypothetical protein